MTRFLTNLAAIVAVSTIFAAKAMDAGMHADRPAAEAKVAAAPTPPAR